MERERAGRSVTICSLMELRTWLEIKGNNFWGFGFECGVIIPAVACLVELVQA